MERQRQEKTVRLIDETELCNFFELRHDIAVRKRYAFWRARGAGSVKEDSRILWPNEW